MLEVLLITQRSPHLRTTFFENCWEHHTWQHTKVARPQPMTARIATKAAPLCTNLASSATYATSQARLSSVAPDYEHMTDPKQVWSQQAP